MDTTKIAEQIANYGFPIVLSGYLLVRMETKLDKLTEGINELRAAILLLRSNKEE
ncbi:MAG TPA: YvrJ family protein [Candidatus Avacidaminococcus intestinavium]|uniref:YvrJ family protein n=1 Tax=Candidatus Avacidaminococcus intestinavium TaxID=2840684 RepID=A0A9D1MPK0_9FIRM|nr:YvrJ family protein [Candidatus Avacidaminococcus intestinavium]